jgi:hypothetical protein
MSLPRLSSILVILTSLCLCAPATAKNMQGKFGIGYQQTLAGARGLSFSYWAADKLAIDLLIGAQFLLDNDSNSSTGIEWSAGIRYKILSRRRANLSVGIKASGGYSSHVSFARDVLQDDGTTVSTPDTADNLFQIAVEAPIDVEFFFSDAFSINIGVGVMFTKVPEEGALIQGFGLGATGEPNTTAIGIGAGGLFGMAGFTFYL